MLPHREIPDKLLKYVRSNNGRGIERLVQTYKEDILLKYQFEEFRNHSILTVVCNDYRFLLEEYNHPKVSEHVNFDNVSKKTIEKLIALGADCNEMTFNDFWEVIHYAAIIANGEKLEAILQFLHGDSVNSLVYCSEDIPKYYPFARRRQNSKSYSNNALHVLLKYGNRQKDFRQCCQMLIGSGVNLHQQDSNGVTPLDLMREEPDLIDLVEKLQAVEKTNTKQTFALIYSNNEEEFLKLKLQLEDDVDGSNEKNSSCTLLQLCCAKGLTSCVDHLLKSGAPPNKFLYKRRNLQITLAIKEDHEDIVKLLLECPDLILPDEFLLGLQKISGKIDKYMQIILKHLRQLDRKEIEKYFLATNNLGHTVLHYAIAYERSSENIIELLGLGASLFQKDKFGYTPLHIIEPNLLEKCLDSFVGIPKELGSGENFLHLEIDQKKKSHLEISYDALVGSDSNLTYESEFLQHIIGNKKLRFLLNHPVVASYIEVKWRKFKTAVYANILMYCLGILVFVAYGIIHDDDNLKTISSILLIFSFIVIVVREVFQMGLLRKDYFKRVEAYVNIVLCGGIVYILIYNAEHDTESNNQNLSIAFSLAFLTGILGIFLQLSNVSYFSEKVIVLREISINFFKYMCFYIFPILAFFLCFFILRGRDENVFWQTLYEVITMFAGDSNSEYPKKFTTDPIFSHIIYIFFVVLIGIILQNLLVGLAVNDLQKVTKEAEFNDKKEKASYITNLERVVFEDYKNSPKCCEPMYRKLLQSGKVFGKESTLVVEPYNNFCVYSKENAEVKRDINDAVIRQGLEKIIKNLASGRGKEEKTRISLELICERLEAMESIHSRLEKIERILTKLDAK